MTRRSFLILGYTPYFGNPMKSLFGDPPPGWTYTEDRRQFKNADIVIFHLPDYLRPKPLAKPPGQTWVGLSQESEANYPQQADAAYMSQFDLRMSYHRDADIPYYYVHPGQLPQLYQPPQPKTRSHPVVCFVSNAHDKNGRLKYIQELSLWIPVDIYGKGVGNCTLVQDAGYSTKLETIAQYPFILAFENSTCSDYVTEKIYHALMAGSVPVYMGTPGVQDFLPHPHCCLRVDDYASPEHLARHLREILNDRALYESFLAWKKEPPAPSFLKHIHDQDTPLLARICATYFKKHPHLQAAFPSSSVSRWSSPFLHSKWMRYLKKTFP